MQITFIITGLAFLVATIVQLIADMVRMFASAQFKFEALFASLSEYLPSLAASVKQLTDVTLANSQWLPYIEWVLAMPTFATLGVLGLFFIVFSFLFRKRKNRKDKADFI
ncbi:MAG: hypothetical protein OCD03_16500 [Hyphomicrobiales bacterium]